LMKNITIKTTEKELQLIQKALELYTRVGLLQFEYLDVCTSLNTLIWNKVIATEFEDKALELRSLFKESPGIFNKKVVCDDVRIACNLYQDIRHEFWRAKGEESVYTVASNPSDICRIA